MPGATHELTDQVEALILEALELGGTEADAAHYADKDPDTLRKWKRRGDEGEEPFAGLVGAITRAKIRHKLQHVGQQKRACFRGTKTTIYNKDGSVLKVIDAPPDWRAGAWWLSRRHPEEFAERALERQAQLPRLELGDPRELAVKHIRLAVAVLGADEVRQEVDRVTGVKVVTARIVPGPGQNGPQRPKEQP